MGDFDRYTRINKFEKRRKNTKLMSVLIMAASFLVILLIGIWIFGPDDDPSDNNATPATTTNPDQAEDEPGAETENTDDSVNTEENSSQDNEESSQTDENNGESNLSDEQVVANQNSEKESVGTEVDDDNIIDAYTGSDWSPIGTEQVGPHTTVYDDGTQDRIEMEMAIRSVTGLAPDDMITWWLENGGFQKVIGTVSNRAETEIYRVYLSWIDGQGWQPTLVEVLKENDQKWRFEEE